MDPEPITEIEISANKEQEIRFQRAGFTKVNVNLNSDTTGPGVFLWYRRGGNNPVTRIQASFSKEMNKRLKASGFTEIPQKVHDQDYPIHLWYIRGTTEYDFPIVDMKVTNTLVDALEAFLSGWECVGCNLNRKNPENPVFIWVKRREKIYICNITATTNFPDDPDSSDGGASGISVPEEHDDVRLLKEGYTRVDEDINGGVNSGGVAVFVWYRCSTYSAEGTITGIDVSIDDEVKDNFTKVDKNLNSGTTGNRLYLCYRSGFNHPPVQHLMVFVNDKKDKTLKAYQTKTIRVVEVNLNCGITGSDTLYIAYK